MDKLSVQAKPRERVLAAARVEFAEYGLAGSRIDRIAKGAATSKERVYAYYRSKSELYTAVIVAEVRNIATAVPFDPADLLGYVGRVYDYYRAHPKSLQLMRWSELESSREQMSESGVSVLTTKVEAVRQAQRRGQLNPDWEPLDVVILTHRLASTTFVQPDRVMHDDDNLATREDFHTARRAALVKAATLLFAPKPAY